MQEEGKDERNMHEELGHKNTTKYKNRDQDAHQLFEKQDYHV